MTADDDLETARIALARGDGETAVAALNRLLRDHPDHPEGLYLMAVCANAAGRSDVAVNCLRAARRVAPDDPDVAFSLGTLLAKNAPQEGLEVLREATRLRPGFAPAWTNMGNLLRSMGLLEQAAAAYEQALEADPDQVEVETNLGVIQQSQGLHEAALRHHENVVIQRPDFRTGQHNRLMSMHYNDRITRDEILTAHRNWGRAAVTRDKGRHKQSADFANSRERGRVLRVGYVSPDFRQHPVASFVLPLLRAHDRTRFDIWCYSDVAVPDAMTARIRDAADHWIEAGGSESGWSDEVLADRIVSDRIDILVDLAGHTSGNRLPVFAKRAAPIQFTWLGYPGITGLPQMDFRLTDAVADPVGDGEDHGAEHLVRLPDGFLCYLPPVDLAVGKPEMSDRRVVFGSFNNFAKVNDSVIDCWAEILRRSPAADILLKARSLNDPGTRRRCAEAFAARGVDPDRVRLRGTVPGLVEHFAAYDEMDIALDTFPYNGTTTTFDALWMGTPVVSLRGGRHAARVGASILAHSGLPELIAEDRASYIKTAVDLAGDPGRCAGYAASLRGKLNGSCLLDADRFARTIEKTYRDKWINWGDQWVLL